VGGLEPELGRILERERLVGPNEERSQEREATEKSLAGKKIIEKIK
jgi:hypothetical protein